MFPDQVILTIFPFENLSPEKGHEIFCRSFVTDLVTELSRFRQFAIIFSNPQTSAESNYSIRGVFQLENDQLKVNVQLINSKTNQIVWGTRLKDQITELIRLQDDLLLQVVGVLQQQVNADLLKKIKKKQNVQFNAYEHWLYGMEEIKKGSVENDLTARVHFQKAIDLQPDYSLAHSGMSLTYFNEWSCQLWDRWDASRSGAYEWAQKAIELDDQNYIASLILGKIFLFNGAYETAEFYIRKSFNQNSNDPDLVIQVAAYMLLLDYKEEAKEIFHHGLKLNPPNLSAYNAIGSVIYFELGEFEKAASLILESKEFKWADADAYNAAIYFYLNDPEKTQTYWDSFLIEFRKKIMMGADFSIDAAAAWILKINPYRTVTKLEPFLKHITNGQFEKKTPLAGSTKQKSSQAGYFLKEDNFWKICFEDEVVQLTELKGFYDLQKMLAQPRHFFHCTDLMGSVLMSEGEKLFDSKAKREYGERINFLKQEIQDADLTQDYHQLERLQEEYDELIEHLMQATGMKGRAREAGNLVEKARSAVTWRIRSAIARIEMQHPMLGVHLSNSVKTGAFCQYQPERSIPWVTS